MNRLLSGKKKGRVRFAQCDYEPTDAEFYYEFSKYNESSMWICLMFLMTAFVQFSLEIDNTIFNIATYKEESCIYAALQSIPWRHNETALIFYPELRMSCMMYDYNITELSTMRYRKAVKVLAQREKPPVVYCSAPLVYSNFSWSSDFIGTCKGALFRKRIRSSKLLGIAFGSLILGTMADLYGRKVSILISLAIYTVGMIVQQLMNSFVIVRLMTAFKGMGKAGLEHIVLILFLECCSKNNRAILVLYVKILTPLGTIMGIHMKKHLSGFCPELRFLIGIPCLLCIFYVWYIPESPRWSLSQCRKEEAWEFLHSLGTRTNNLHFLPNLNLNKWAVLTENLKNIFTIPKFIKTITLCIYLLFLLVILEYSKKQYIDLQGLLAPYGHHALLSMAKLFSYMYVLPPVIILRRRLALLWFFLLIFVQLGVNIKTTVNVYYILNILMMLTIYAVRSLFLLYICEIFPTCFRATAHGFLICIAVLLYFTYYMCEIKVHVVSLRIQNIVLFCATFGGLIVICLLPEVKHDELSDYKRYRRDYEEVRQENL